jgi:glucokinase
VLAKHIDVLTDLRLVRRFDRLPSTGGRPPEPLSFNTTAGLVLAGDVQPSVARLALTDLGGQVLLECEDPVDLDAGPGSVMGRLIRRWGALLETLGRAADDVAAVALAVPGLVDPASGRITEAPGLPSWLGFRPAEALAAGFPVAVLVDSDVNMMAIGEQRMRWPNQSDLIFVKVGEMVAAGLVAGGRLLRGARGSAGDIAHVRVEGREEPACLCGSCGCLAAFASGPGLAARLNRTGVPTADEAQVTAHIVAGVPEALMLAREAGRAIGCVLSTIVNAVNPSVVVLGGGVAGNPPVLAAVREEIYRRSRTAATQDLRVEFSPRWELTAVRGATQMAIEQLLAPHPLEVDLARILSAPAGPRQWPEA